MAQRSMAVEPQVQLSQPSRQRPIDRVHLARQCLGDAHLEEEILRLFDTTLATYFGRLQLAESFDDLAANLHAIKGASAGVGAVSVAELAQGMEAELRAGRPLKAEHIHDLGMAVEEVRGFIARFLAEAAE